MAYTTIDDPSAYFHTQLYTGNGASTRAITNDANAGDFQPDWLWIKQRSQGARSHSQWDSSRGASQRLQSDITGAEETQTNDQKSFDTNGFTVGSGNITNENSQTFAAWQWKCNSGSTSVNNSGSVQSTVQVNQDAGFSIVTYTGTGSGDITVGHGLGAVPKLIIGKVRNQAYSWRVYHASVGNNKTLVLNGNNAAASSNSWGNTTPTSSVFTAGRGGDDNMNFGSGDTIVAYCFAEKQGYSKFGSFTGNGNVDGPFIYTGFKPAFAIFKRTDTTGNWYMMTGKIGDNGQDGNPLEDRLEANTNVAEADMGQGYDFLSNGIKVRHNGGEINGSANTFIYMAFAEHPFVSSTGAPTTAR